MSESVSAREHSSTLELHLSRELSHNDFNKWSGVSLRVRGQKDMKHFVVSEWRQSCQLPVHFSRKLLALDAVALALVCCFCVVFLFSIRSEI